MSFQFESDDRWRERTANRPLEFFAAELEIFRAALHLMARDFSQGTQPPSHVLDDEQSYVDHYIAWSRTGRRIGDDK